MPGATVTVWTTPDRAGSYEVTCAQLCGIGHYLMHGAVTVESPEALQKSPTTIRRVRER